MGNEVSIDLDIYLSRSILYRIEAIDVRCYMERTTSGSIEVVWFMVFHERGHPPHLG